MSFISQYERYHNNKCIAREKRQEAKKMFDQNAALAEPQPAAPGDLKKCKTLG